MNNLAITGATAVILAAAIPFQAHASTGPSFDCRRATSRIEHVLCSDGNPELAWLDRVLGLLFDARLAAAVDVAPRNALVSAEKSWLARRNRCGGTDDAIAECLQPLYWHRIQTLAASADPDHVTGSYAAPAIGGTLHAVALPNGAVGIDAESNIGPPSYDNCGLATVLTRGRAGRMTYDAAADGDLGDAGCVFTVTHEPGRFAITSSHCPAFCGYGATLDSDYTATPAPSAMH